VTILFTKIDDPYSNEVFDLMKAGLHPYVSEVFGWDDAFQRQRMRNDYQPEWFYWVMHGPDRIGFVCYKRYGDSLHVHLVVIAQAFQGIGYGRKVMRAIQDIARSEHRDVTLTAFRRNERAVRLYSSMGYDVISEEEHFLSFHLTHARNCDLQTPT
jgi:ribosomal protein S18 acetylase RimI-like enzyme